jgi:YegS/Rv2252/BmrU family lipid kinase
MIWFIVNRVSGHGRGYKVWRRVETLLKTKQIDYGVTFTERPRHATEIAKTLSKQKNMDKIVAVGGDGTLHEVANGLVGSGVALGYIPAGSGNDFARGLRIPRNCKKALQQVLSGTKRSIDIALISQEIIINAAGIGFDGQVAKTTNQAKYKKWLNRLRLGKFSYIFSAMKVLIQYQPSEVTVVIDNQEHTFRHVWLIAIANIPFYGGGMIICPEARCDDGQFDVCIVHGISRWTFLKLFPRVFTGTHIFHHAVTTLTGKQMEVMSTFPLPIHGDGEILGETPTVITIKKGALDVI